MSKSLVELTKECETVAKKVYSTISQIFDTKSFVELDKYVGGENFFGENVGEGVVTGVGEIDSKKVAIACFNPDSILGSVGVKNTEKVVRIIKHASKLALPLVVIADTQGARVGEGVEMLEGYSNMMSAFALATQEVPTYFVVSQQCYGMTSYLAKMADFVVMYDKSRLATTSPLIIASKKNVSEDTVATAKKFAARGISTVTVKSNAELKSFVSATLSILRREITEDKAELNRVVSSPKLSCDELIMELADKNSIINLYAEYSQIRGGLMRIGGMPIVFYATSSKDNEGRLTSEGMQKITRLIEYADNFSLPLVSLVDSSGLAYESCQCELLSNSAELVKQYAISDCHKIALIYGKAIGASYTILSAKSNNNYVLAWDKATVGALESMQMAELVYSEQIAAAKDKDKIVSELSKAYLEENMSAAVLGYKGIVDNVIDPLSTRIYLINYLQTIYR